MPYLLKDHYSAMAADDQFRAFAERMSGVPLLANITEFGRAPYQMVIRPISSLRAASKVQEKLCNLLKQKGKTQAMLPEMQTRATVYELIGPAAYEALDASIAASVLPAKTL